MAENRSHLGAPEDDEPLSDQEGANVEGGLTDIREGRMISLDDYELPRPSSLI